MSFGVDDVEIVEVEGCTDSTAFNYDPYATVDDGTCFTTANVKTSMHRCAATIT